MDSWPKLVVRGDALPTLHLNDGMLVMTVETAAKLSFCARGTVSDFLKNPPVRQENGGWTYSSAGELEQLSGAHIRFFEVVLEAPRPVIVNPVISQDIPRTAFFSVARKTSNVAAMAQFCLECGLTNYASFGTRKFLVDNGVACHDYAELGYPPILDHGVVSLQVKVFAALLAVGDNTQHRCQLYELDAPYCHVFVGSFYDLAGEMSKEGVSLESIVNFIDVGGPAQAVAAAKRGRIVITNDDAIPTVIAEMRTNGGALSERTLRRLRRDALHDVSKFYALAATLFESTAE